MVVAIVIRTVGFCVIRWRQGGHFVSIYGVTTEKVLHFVCHLIIQMSNQILSSYNMYYKRYIVCVCEGERQRKKQKERDRERNRKRQKKNRERESDRETQKETERERERNKETEEETETEKAQRETDRETQKQTDRETKRDRERKREREREREIHDIQFIRNPQSYDFARRPVFY